MLMASFTEKIKKGIKNPRRAVRVIQDKISAVFRKKYDWKEDKGTLQTKKYKSYEQYVEHQKSKLDVIKGNLAGEYDVKYREVLLKRLQTDGSIKPGMNVLCLAARIGTEVKSFLDLGCFAVGLDLNPGKDNKYVVTGDFHHIQFADHTVDAMFCNSLDHALDLTKLIAEMKRVLKPTGLLVLEVMGGATEDGSNAPGYWEALAWDKVDDLLKVFIENGFNVKKSTDFSYPWKGQHVVMGLM